MKRSMKRRCYELRFTCGPLLGPGIENLKRRHSLETVGLDQGSRMFFERLVSARKVRELVFVSKSIARTR